MSPRPKDTIRTLRSESERVFEHAENHRYVERAQESKLGTLIYHLRHPQVRERTEELFSREVLGSVLIAATTTRTIEASVAVAFGAVSAWRIPVWLCIWATAVTLFIWWEHVGDKATNAAEKATDKADEVTDKANEVTDKADEMTDKAKDAADSTSEAVKKAADAADAATSKADEATDKADAVTTEAEKAADAVDEKTTEEAEKAEEEAETDLLDDE